MSTVIENKIFKKLLNSTPWNLQESALGGLGEGVHLPRIETQGSVRPRHSFKVSRRAPPRSFACSDLYANYDRLPRPPGPAAEDACQAQGKAASVRTECRISIRSGWILGDQDEQAKPTGSFPAVPHVPGVTAPPFGCGFGRQVPGAQGATFLWTGNVPGQLVGVPRAASCWSPARQGPGFRAGAARPGLGGPSPCLRGCDSQRQLLGAMVAVIRPPVGCPGPDSGPRHALGVFQVGPWFLRNRHGARRS